ncbi:MAG: hypothetical protein JNK75_07915 [Betaproteobacteria bacterium]|nr:hypothetical protein [Betaproteobacteria bacterium]
MSPKTKLAALLALFILPTLASFAVFYWFPPASSANYGTLIVPALPLPKEAWARIDGQPGEPATALAGRWLLVTRVSGPCAEACRARLHAMKQARLILGREQDRVVRVVLAEDGAPPAADVVQAFAGTVWIDARSSAWKTMLPGGGDANVDRIYGVDPLRNAFIYYGADADIQRLAKDLKKVLKASQIG